MDTMEKKVKIVESTVKSPEELLELLGKTVLGHGCSEKSEEDREAQLTAAAKRIASATRILYNAFVEEGFTEEAAIKLVINHMS